MEMSTAYLEETVAWLVARGFVARRSEDVAESDGAVLFERTRWDLDRGTTESLSLEALHYPDGSRRWCAAVLDWHGMSVTSFPLDSWKHRPDRAELKFAVDPETGLGLAFVLRLAAPD